MISEERWLDESINVAAFAESVHRRGLTWTEVACLLKDEVDVILKFV